jgi:conjugative transfer signal peptidase TraF
MNRRRIVATLLMASAFTFRLALQHAGLRVNLTASEPRGLYLTEQRPWGRGSLVVFLLPARLSAVALERGYAFPGPTAGRAMDGLKRVAALPGDTVVLASNGLTINGNLRPASKPLGQDSSGRPIHHYPFGTYRVGHGQAWLVSDNPRGWDSRYFGPLPVSKIICAAEPLLTIR